MGRRSALRLLGVGAFGLLAGCRSGKQQSAPTGTSPSATPATGAPPAPASTSPAPRPSSPLPTVLPLSADQLVARRVAVAEEALLAAYDAAADAHPELAGRLAPFRADHAAHLHGLVPEASQSTPAPVSTAPSSPTSASAASASAPLSSPPASTAILQQLAALERSAAAARIDDVATTSGSLARFIASIGGCEAAHAALLSVAT
jgi:hypothetical protein